MNSYNSRFGPVTQVTPGTAELARCDAPAVPDVDLLLGAFDASDGRIVRGAYNGKLALPCVYAARWATASWRRWRAAERGPRSPIACARGGT